MRYDLYKFIKNDPDYDIDIYNVFSINWNDFEFENPYTTHVITEIEVNKPWMISYNEYETVDYEDIIFILNDIADPREIYAGQKIIIPDVNDIKGFIIRNQQS